MDFKTLLVEDKNDIITITFNRVPELNSINNLLLEELNNVLDVAEQNSQCKFIILQGKHGYFCTGMDFKELSKEGTNINIPIEGTIKSPFMDTIRRLSLIPKVIISKVDGKVMAGGMGLIAVSDFVVATSKSEFSLSEALWGLIPAVVMPYLIRRIGFQMAYRLTLTTLPISAKKAYDINLVDELDDSPENIIRQLWLRMSKLDIATITKIKQYFRNLWIIDNEMEDYAVSEITKLLLNPHIRENIRNFVQYRKFPWDKYGTE
jgi:polyketide biosynthesis enoyl-CoA hydratase PksH